MRSRSTGLPWKTRRTVRSYAKRSVMGKPVIAVDMDEVLFGFMAPFLAFVKDETGRDYPLDEFKSDLLEDTIGGTREEANALVESFLRHERFRRERSPIVGAPEAAARLAQEYELHVVTARPD